MGHTIKSLFKQDLPAKSIFNNRFVIEVAESFHLHYRNVRINLSLSDFTEMAEGFVKAYDRWKSRGTPEPAKGMHLELCRRKVGQEVVNEGLQINLNDNLYNANEGRIFSEGADFKEPEYIHLKIRDIRIEMPKSEFKEFAKGVAEADAQI